MARPKKKRNISLFPTSSEFVATRCDNRNKVSLSIDEFEVIKLLDYENLSQEEAAYRMNVARTTVTSIYDKARKKLANFLIEGRRLVIQNGDEGVFKGNVLASIEIIASNKGELTIMRIAVPYENGEIFQHFGRTPAFKIYDVEDKKIVKSEILSCEGNGHAALGGWLTAHHVNAVICGGIGAGAIGVLSGANIKVFTGVVGKADQAINGLIDGTLECGLSDNCDHHHEEQEHECECHHECHCHNK